MVSEVEWLNEMEMKVWRRWLRVQTELPAALGRELAADSELSMQDYETMVRLHESEGCRLRISELADQMHWERSRLSHHLRRMENRGLIVKESCATDGRGAFVRLTDDGIKALSAAAPGHVQTVRRYFLDGMSEEELHTLGRVLEGMLERVEAAPTP